MRPIVVLLLLTFLSALAPAPARAADPSQLFLNAYLAVQQGEKLERSGKNSAALARFRYAANLLQQVKQDNPDWQPLIVDYRRNKTADAIQRVEEKIATEGPGVAAPVTTDMDEPLPERDGTTPSVSDSPAPVDTLERATSEIRSKMTSLQDELDDARKEVTALQRDRDSMARRLAETEKTARDAQVTEAELKARLKQAEDALNNATGDRSSNSEQLTTMRAQIDNLTVALQTARAERDAADEIAGALSSQQKELRGKLADVERTLEQALTSNANKQTEKLNSEIAKLRDALNEARAERDAADEFATTVRSKLATERAYSGQQIATLTTERDQALAEAEKMRKSQEQVTELLASNEDLTKRLADAREALKNINSDNPDKDAEIDRLKEDIRAAREELVKVQYESTKYQTAMVDLQRRLDELNAGGDASMSRENLLLRGIILRQLKEQARRDQAKKLVLSELAKLETQSDSLITQIEYLGGPVTELTDEEKALFREPQIEILDTEKPSTAAFEIAAPKAEEAAPSSPAGFESDLPSSLFDAPTLPGAAPAGGLFGPEKPASPQVETAAMPRVPPELLPLAEQAREKFERGDYREAEKLYEKVLAEAPNNLYALSNLGVSRYRGGKLRLAEEALKKAIAINPDDAFSYRTLGIVYYTQGKFDDAIDALTKGLAVNPKDAIGHNYLGIAASQKGWPEAAFKEFETAIALDPNYADAHFNLAVIHISAKPPRKEKAREHYDQAVKLGAPPDPALEKLMN